MEVTQTQVMEMALEIYILKMPLLQRENLFVTCEASQTLLTISTELGSEILNTFVSDLCPISCFFTSEITLGVTQIILLSFRVFFREFFSKCLPEFASVFLSKGEIKK